MRSFWSKIPMLRVTLAFIAGVLLQIYTAPFSNFNILLLVATPAIALLSIAVMLAFGLFNITLQYKYRVLNGVAIYLCIACLAFLLAFFHVGRNKASYFANQLSGQSTVVARVTEPPVQKGKVINIVAVVEEVNRRDSVFNTEGKILLNISRSDSVLDIKYGDVIAFNSRVMEPEPPHNPSQFDYKRYLQFQNIYHTAYLKQGEWKLIERGKGSFLMRNVYRVRSYFLSLITDYVKDENDFGVASAIMLGFNDYVSRDLMQAYASSGVLHVLSVSGLHVGIVFIMLNFLLGGLDKKGRKWQIGKAVFIILFIWFYACLTGLSSPVLRSALMFSMLQAGRLMFRNANTYNILAASALLLMLLNPFIITETGFQLSYIAVAGIIFLQPKIAAWVVVRNPYNRVSANAKWYLKPLYFIRYDLGWLLFSIPDAAWQLCAASIAAQIATLPVTLYYFHQFPVLFLLTNLVVIPLSNLVLFAGTALFILGSIPYLNTAAGFVFKWLLFGLDKFIFWINSLPFALINSISFGVLEMVLLCALLGVWAYVSEGLKPRAVVASLVLLLAFCLANTYKYIEHRGQKIFAVYDVPRQSAIAFLNGATVCQNFDSNLIANKKIMGFYILPHWIERGIKTQSPLPSSRLPLGCLVQLGDKRVLLVDSSYTFKHVAANERLKVDWVVISHSSVTHIDDLVCNYDFDEVIFDSSNKPWALKKAKQAFTHLGIRCWDVGLQGAFVKSLD